VVTEAGQYFNVMKGRNMKLLWEKFDEIHAMKFGTPDTDAKKTIFNNDVNDPRKACVLTKQSLRLCLDKGRTIEEVDLDRVVEVRNGLLGKKILQVALSRGQIKQRTVLCVELGKHENEEKLSIAICEQAKQRKNDLKAQTALVA